MCSWRPSLLLIWVSLAQQVMASESSRPDFLRAERFESHPSGDYHLYHAPFPELRSRIAYLSKGDGRLWIPEETRMVLLFLTGTGARKNTSYGLEKSTAYIAYSLQQIGVTLIGIENPLYDDISDEERISYIETVGTMRAQVDFVHQALEWFKAEIREQSNAPLGLISRSTGSLNGLQALVENLKGEKNSFLGLKHFFPWGLLDHRPGAFHRWRARQQFYLDREASSGNHLADDDVLQREPEMFLPMDWTRGSQLVQQLPELKIHFLLGSADELASPLDQWKAIESFRQAWPSLQSQVYGLPVHHNPFSSYSYRDNNGKVRQVRQGRAARLVIERILAKADAESLLASPIFSDQVRSFMDSIGCESFWQGGQIIPDPKHGK